MQILYCCGCEKAVQPRLTDGEEIYPHRKDLFSLPFWKCDDCGNYVGCHHKTKNRTNPLGCIPTKAIKVVRRNIHEILDPLWRSEKYTRKGLYALISDEFGWKYHTASIKSAEEGWKIYEFIAELEQS